MSQLFASGGQSIGVCNLHFRLTGLCYRTVNLRHTGTQHSITRGEEEQPRDLEGAELGRQGCGAVPL